MSNKGKHFEKNRREYWNNRPDTIDVFRDTYGPTDLAVIFKQNVSWDWNVLLIEIKANGRISSQHRERLERLLERKPETVALRIEFREDIDGHYGHGNTTYTRIEKVNDFDKHNNKIKKL
jgi:hypothetical protein